MRGLKLNFWVDVHKIQRSRTSGREDAKVMSAWVQGIECSERIAARVISTCNVCIDAEPRLKWYCREPISSIGSKCPCFDACRTEGAELPDALKVKVQSGPFRGGGMENPRTHRVAHLLGCASFECHLLTVQPQVIHVQHLFVWEGSRGVDAPKTNGMVWVIIEEAKIVEVRSHGERVNTPRVRFSLDLKSIEA